MEERAGNMRPCGCHRGRPCTCAMGEAMALATMDFACGECMNCVLNAKSRQKQRKARRKCIKHDTYRAEMAYDRIQITPSCVFRMRKPDWRVEDKSAFYTRLRQMRLAMEELRLQTAAIVKEQKVLRKKYNRDLLRTEEVLLKAEERRASTIRLVGGARRTTPDETHIDSDVFDSHSKQLIPAMTLLPELKARLEQASAIILSEESNWKIVEAFVRDAAARKLQSFAREWKRARRWKCLWIQFKADSQIAAAVTIQASYRMLRSKRIRRFLDQLKQREHLGQAASRLGRFFRRLQIARRVRLEQLQAQQEFQQTAKKFSALGKLWMALGRIACRSALLKWKERNRQATAFNERRTTTSVVTIQRMYRGFRDRLHYERVRYRWLLSDRVRFLFDKFIVRGDLWGFLFEVDADYRRFENEKRIEEKDARTFVSDVVREKQVREDQVMQEWFSVSAMKSPIVRGAQNMMEAFQAPTKTIFMPTARIGSLSHSLLHSALSADLVAINPGNKLDELFPDDLPATVVRHALCEGFQVPEIVAAMRGLIAQGKSVSNAKIVMKALKSRAPLMRSPWIPERLVRQETGPEDLTKRPIEKKEPSRERTPLAKPMRQAHGVLQCEATQFVSDNLLESIPGGLNGSIDRLVLVAALKCYDPTATAGKGSFVFRIDASNDPWRSYRDISSPLVKVRREQIVLEVIKPHVKMLKDMGCFTAYDILRDVHGVDEMVSWKVPRPLAMSIYDVIELIHRQTVNRSKRNIRRQARVSAQFEAFWQRSKAHDRMGSLNQYEVWKGVSNPGVDRCRLIMDVSQAIQRDVLKLPLMSADGNSEDILFNAHFLCGDRSGPDESDGSYGLFVERILDAQLDGDTRKMKNLVKERTDRARLLAAHTSRILEEDGIKCARHMLDLRELVRIKLDPPLFETLDSLLTELRATHSTLDGNVPSQMLSHKPKRHSDKSPQLTPLLQHSQVTFDGPDEKLLNIQLPH